MTLPTPVQAVDLARKVISGDERPDLDAHLARARERLLDERIRVLVVGEYKQGKSFLVNALVSACACPVHDDVATSVPTVVRHAETPCVSLVRTLGSDGSGVPAEERSDLSDVEVADVADRIAGHVLESRDPAAGPPLSYAEIGLPRTILVGGLEIVDMPGAGGLDSVHGAATTAALPAADAVLLVSDASQELTASELELLRRAAELCPNVACVLTKVDLYPQWRRIAELDRGHLRAAGVDCGLIAVSSAVRWQAVTGGDASLNEESGFPALESYLYERVVTDADRLRRRSAVHDIVRATDQVLACLRAERRALQDPEAAGDLIGRLNEAQRRAAALAERSARWQHTLDDGVTDLDADVEADLRDRVREIARLAQHEIDENGDPVPTWPQLAGWVERQAAAVTSANVVRATQLARLVAGRVATRFAEEQEQILPASCAEPCAALSTARGPLRPFAGRSLVDPFAPEYRLPLGATVPSEERCDGTGRHAAEATAAVQRYLDDLVLGVGEEFRGMLRGVQRDLRGRFGSHAEQLGVSLRVAVRSVEESARTSTVVRERRLAELPVEIERLEQLQERARTLLPQARDPRAGPPGATGSRGVEQETAR